VEGREERLVALVTGVEAAVKTFSGVSEEVRAWRRSGAPWPADGRIVGVLGGEVALGARAWPTRPY